MVKMSLCGRIIVCTGRPLPLSWWGETQDLDAAKAVQVGQKSNAEPN